MLGEIALIRSAVQLLCRFLSTGDDSCIVSHVGVPLWRNMLFMHCWLQRRTPSPHPDVHTHTRLRCGRQEETFTLCSQQVEFRTDQSGVEHLRHLDDTDKCASGSSVLVSLR